MRNGRDFSLIIEAARTHYENLKTDIANAHNRIEHIRLTTLAQEAHNLLTDLLVFEMGLVYSHTNNTDGYVSGLASKPIEETLDLPEFKSPYLPPKPLG
jgi:hypothetical protein